ncbi:MAG: CD225/dispanin family protein, partial [Muribaculaceae bacterium]|nr:CD225/dispanin family protein [Muribaculaceae bacterium]
CQAPELADIFGAAEPEENQAETTTVRAARPAAAAVCDVETAEALPPRPSAFLAWSIILTLCCCTPFSLAAVVTGALTTQRYNRGDYEGAQRMSGITEWLVIISITLGIVGLPISMIAMM